MASTCLYFASNFHFNGFRIRDGLSSLSMGNFLNILLFSIFTVVNSFQTRVGQALLAIVLPLAYHMHGSGQLIRRGREHRDLSLHIQISGITSLKGFQGSSRLVLFPRPRFIPGP